MAAVWTIAAVVRSDGAEQPIAPVYAPAETLSPWRFGIPLDVETIDSAARTLPRLHSLLVSRGSELVFERYYNGTRRDHLANIKSVSKSIISVLVGVAIGRGLIQDVRTPISTWFPELSRDPDARKRAITVEDLLTMRSGLEGTSNRNYGAWVLSRNWVQHVLARPMFAAPGEEMEYSTGNTHLLSAILTKVSGTSTWQFASDVLAKPLGFSLAQWPRDPQGIYFGGNEMLMTPRQMLAFGELYLNKGRINGQQIVPEPWVEKSCEGRERRVRRNDRFPGPDSMPDPIRDRRYGYGWWIRDFADHEVCFAWGYGGQYVFVVPDLELVVIATSSPEVSDARSGYRLALFDIFERLVWTGGRSTR